MGQKFGRLKFLAEVGRDRHNKRLGKFRCECGNETVKVITSVTSGHIETCGHRCPWSNSGGKLAA